MNISKIYRNIMLLFAFVLFASNSFAFDGRGANLKYNETEVQDIRGPK